MPSSQLFSINNHGRVYSLSTDQSVWRELPYLGVEFKRVSAHETVIWALGGDHQVYVYVYGSPVPIRVCEESYENQRWNPIEGFSGVLLPSDRPPFSSQDGLTDRKMSSITLPTLAWSWESPWHLHHTYEGQALDKEGWTYAVDFPRTYTAEKKWNSCVRRRKWVRYRRYVALDTWSAVPPIHQDHTKEPFIDISVGGGEVSGEDPDKLMVWGVTVLGRVMVRSGVDGTCPEGCGWEHIATPPERDVTTIGVGRSGRVWAITWDGTIIVRTGVTRDTPTGISWVVVEAPNGSPVQQIAVGVRVVWTVTRDNHVWFRRGLESSESNKTANGTSQTKAESNTTGSSWLMMVGSLNMISVGPNDQVWGIGNEDFSLLVRTGITEAELTGRTWRPICLPIDLSVTPEPSPSPSPAPSPGPLSKKSSEGDDSASASVLSRNIEPQSDEKNIDLSQLSLQTSDEENLVSMATAMKDLQKQEEPSSGSGSVVESNNVEENKVSLPSLQVTENEKEDTNLTVGNEKTETSPGNDSRESSIKIRYPDDYPSSLSSSIVSDTGNEFISSLQAADGSPVSNGISALTQNNTKAISSEEVDNKEPQGISKAIEQAMKNEEEKEEQNGRPSPQHSSGEWSESRLRHISNSSAGSEVGIGRGSLVVTREEKPEYNVLTFQPENLWLWISGGGCWVSANNMPRWFTSVGSPVTSSEPWRAEVLQRLHCRQEKEIKPYEGYEEAVEGSSWVITGQCRWWVRGQLVPATLELTMVGSRRSQVQDATLVVHYNLGTAKMVEIPCCAILMCVISIEPGAGKSVVGFYQPSEPLQPKTLVFSAETDAEDWLNHISNACNQFRGLVGRPSPYTVWAVTTKGDMYLHDCSVTEKELRAESVAAHKNMDIGSGATPLTLLLDRGFRPGCFISVSGKIHDKADQFHINLQTSRTTDANIALHVNPRFSKNVAILNSKKKGRWGLEEKSDLANMSQGTHCEISIVCDDKDFKISVNDKFWYSYNHQLPVGDITHLVVRGNITVDSITYNHGASEGQLNEWYWRGLGGHLLRVESGAGGVTWAISHDYHVYTYTGATGGGLYKGSSNDSAVNIMSDVRHMYVWENQRWNPVTGFTHRGLPTDRHTWSDQSGRHHRTREGTKLPSRHWSWMSEWCVDYHTPGGVDREGWQYATDFPLSYHGHRYMTDLVRRRRWVRKCRISTSGPWQQLEKVALVHVSISPKYGEDGTVPIWGVSVTGEVVYRHGVTPSKPEGVKWSLVPAECPMCFVCATIDNCGMWAVSKDGRAHLRIGVTKKNPQGQQWVNVDAPNQPLVEIGAGSGIVWGLERGGGLYRRTNVLALFPEGTSWEWVCGNVASISVTDDGTLWAVLETFEGEKGPVQGVIARRVGVSSTCPVGTGWENTLGTGWSHVSARVPLPL